MKRIPALITLLVFVFAALTSSSIADPGARTQEPRRPESRRELLRARMSLPPASSALLVEFADDAARSDVTDAVEGVDGDVVANLSELGRVKVVEVVPGGTEAAVEELAQDPAVDVVESDTHRIPLGIPNDPLFPQQWGLHNTGQRHPIADRYSGFPTSRVGKKDADVDAPQAWNVEDGSSNQTIIAVLDQGFDIAHSELADALWENPYEIADNRKDDDRNGYVDDIHGWDFDGNDPNPSDPGGSLDAGHGTHVAATAAGTTNNSKGIAGMCPHCELLPLRFGMTLRQELEAINYLIGLRNTHPELKIRVLNASFGSWEWSALERRALERLGDVGVLTVAAAGNGGLDNDMFDAADFQDDGIPDDFSPLYPASYDLPKILSVAASNDKDHLGYFSGCDAHPRVPRYRCMFSNWGRMSVDVAAPGTDIKSAFLTKGSKDQYRTWTGTSMAAPLVSGIAGLVAAERPYLGPIGLKNSIMNSADRKGSLKKVWRRPVGDTGPFLHTNGRVNALAALSARTSNATRLNDGTITGARGIRKVRSDSVKWPADVNDVYRKWLKKGNRYAVTLRAEFRGRNIDLVVYKPGTKDVWQLEDGCAGGFGQCHVIQPFGGFSRNGYERIEFRANKSGIHYFLASSYFVNSDYRLKVVRVR